MSGVRHRFLFSVISLNASPATVLKCHDNSGGRSNEQVKTIGDVRELQVFFEPGENRGGIKPLHPGLIEGKNLKLLMHAVSQNSSLRSAESTQPYALKLVTLTNRLSGHNPFNQPCLNCSIIEPESQNP